MLKTQTFDINARSSLMSTLGKLSNCEQNILQFTQIIIYFFTFDQSSRWKLSENTHAAQ